MHDNLSLEFYGPEDACEHIEKTLLGYDVRDDTPVPLLPPIWATISLKIKNKINILQQNLSFEIN